jgi:hypothetical protein
MSAEIIKVYKEHLPALRLIGKCYTESEVEDGIGTKWGEWFSNGWFDELEKLGPLPESEGAYLGFMRNNDNDFEYWIGMFFPAGTQAPEEYAYADIDEGDIAACWIYGNEAKGELFGPEPHNMCMEKIAEQGWLLQDNPCFFERYNCPRYTTPDEKGNVILDYCAYIK